MCPPVMMMMVGVAQAVTSFGAAQADYNAKATQWQQNYVNALAAGRDEQRQLTLRQLQEEDAFTQKIHLTNLEEAGKKSEVAVDAAGSGVSGITVDNLIADIGRQAANNRTSLTTNYKNVAEQLNTEQKATVTTEESRINSVARPTAPSPLTLAVGVLGAGVRAFAN